MTDERELYRDDHVLIRRHQGTKVSIQTGSPPEDDTPTIVDAVDVQLALREFLNSEVSDGGE